MASKAGSSLGKAAAKGSKRWPHKFPSLTRVVDNASNLQISPKHYKESWSSEQIRHAAQQSVLLTWMPGQAKDNLPILRRGDGVYLFDDQGKSYLDWTSQAVCANLGYNLPATVLEQTLQQMQDLPFVYGGLALTEIRARLADLMAHTVLPADLQGVVFPSSGAEANEAAITLARRYTGRTKILNHYRTYHGGTSNALNATGECRRWYGGDRATGFVKAFSPSPLFWDWADADDADRTHMALNMLHEQILNEGPESIALIQLESIVGSGGVLIPPDGYLQGVRALCDEHGILLHLDEVMVGFGRTGQMFGFQNFAGVVPDIVTAAKGLTAAALPLSMMACREPMRQYLEDHPLGWGSTYQAHPVALACAYETVKYLLEHNVLGHVQRLAPVLDASMRRLAERHPCIKQYRSIGLFGCFDTALPDGSNPQLQHEALHPAFVDYKKAYAENGLIGLVRPPHLHIAPPLTITESELLDGMDRQDRALDVLDQALGF